MRLLWLLLTTGCLITPLVHAQAGGKLQNHEVLREQAMQFLVRQVGATADSLVRVQAIDPELRLPACPAPEFFIPTPPPPVLRGSVRVGVRCLSPQAWAIYMNASVTESKVYYMARGPLEAGHILAPEDIIGSKVQPGEFPAGAVSDPEQLIGRTLRQSLTAGAVLRPSLLRTELVVTAGQAVKLIANGAGFSISSEGRAMGNASSGQRVQVRSASGQIVQGVALPNGAVSITP